MKLFEVKKTQQPFKATGKVTTRSDGTIDVDGDVEYHSTATSLAARFGNVSSHFDCSFTKITSLEGAPQLVDKDFHCYNTLITSLKGAPQSVGGDFHCYNTKIASLEGAPHTVGDVFCCEKTKITSLKGAPQSVGSNFWCTNNPSLSLVDVHKILPKNFQCKQFIFSETVKGGLGLKLVKGIQEIVVYKNDQLTNLFNSTNDVLELQELLIDAGYANLARI